MRRDMLALGMERNGKHGANYIYTASSFGKATSATNYNTGIMILALAMGHTVERPVMGMRGGTINPMEQLCWLPSDLAFDKISENKKSALLVGADFVKTKGKLGRETEPLRDCFL